MKENGILGKHVIDKNYHRLDPVGQSDTCANCSTACKTSCNRKLAQELGNDVSYIIDDPKENKVATNRFYKVTIKDVDSIPCDLKEQFLEYDVDGKLLSEPLEVPWNMDWIYSVLEEYLVNDIHLSGTKQVQFNNPEEVDQIIICEIYSYIQRC